MAMVRRNQAMLRLRERGRTIAEIAALFDMNYEAVKAALRKTSRDE